MCGSCLCRNAKACCGVFVGEGSSHVCAGGHYTRNCMDDMAEKYTMRCDGLASNSVQGG